LRIETKDQIGYFEIPGVNFMVKVDTDNRVLIVGLVLGKPEKPAGLAEGQNWVKARRALGHQG
jgi:hypothetical protein